ncbi:hypothetical protein PtB15_4B789 [Puccinia triticina]|nr:hypothetical protein PtB15_4B789 [Puccinia triticina]
MRLYLLDLKALADTKQSIKHNKRLLRTTHKNPPQPLLLLKQIAAETRLKRARKATLKHSKTALHWLWWAWIVYAIDTFVSAYDLLELKYCGCSSNPQAPCSKPRIAMPSSPSPNPPLPPENTTIRISGAGPASANLVPFSRIIISQ